MHRLSGIKFTFFTLDDIASVLGGGFSVSDNPAIFSVVVGSSALDLLLICFVRWRWYRRRKGKRRRRVAAKQEEREPGFKLRQAGERKRRMDSMLQMQIQMANAASGSAPMDPEQAKLQRAVAQMAMASMASQRQATMSHEERSKASLVVQAGIRRWKARAAARVKEKRARELEQRLAAQERSASLTCFGPLPGQTELGGGSAERWEAARARWKDDGLGAGEGAGEVDLEANALCEWRPLSSGSAGSSGFGSSSGGGASLMRRRGFEHASPPFVRGVRHGTLAELGPHSGETALAAVETTNVASWLCPGRVRASGSVPSHVSRTQLTHTHLATDTTCSTKSNLGSLPPSMDSSRGDPGSTPPRSTPPHSNLGSSPPRSAGGSDADSAAHAALPQPKLLTYGSSPPPSPPSILLPAPPRSSSSSSSTTSASCSRLLRPTRASEARATESRTAEAQERHTSIRASRLAAQSAASVLAFQRARASECAEDLLRSVQQQQQPAQQQQPVQQQQPAQRQQPASTTSQQQANGRPEETDRALALLDGALGPLGTSLAAVDDAISGTSNRAAAASAAGAAGAAERVSDELDDVPVTPLQSDLMAGEEEELAEATRETVSSAYTSSSGESGASSGSGGGSRASGAGGKARWNTTSFDHLREVQQPSKSSSQLLQHGIQAASGPRKEEEEEGMSQLAVLQRLVQQQKDTRAPALAKARAEVEEKMVQEAVKAAEERISERRRESKEAGLPSPRSIAMAKTWKKVGEKAAGGSTKRAKEPLAAPPTAIVCTPHKRSADS